ncbi:putative oxidoreductase DltE [Colletotrichum spaethianum]|uniref:Oxidoreductase DltE n=1 Tax=Colletotrichum spaethianum TaxID=700344 RepID=A0AA37PHQ9_9PEZI|nr:putative oxidoreductase DltE [Colletotrichum spaethianum]GKT52432.1 putative oxidoreductase DltE [Colletotrichum spaethianum]
MPFSPKDDIPDLAGKVIIVTGGSSGLGKESVLQLAKHNPKTIYLTARTEARGKAAIKEIQEAVPAAKDRIKFLELDLASFASIEKAANTFLGSSDRLDILMNNAGLASATTGITIDGYEVNFGSNYMGPALFTKLLLPIIVKTAEQHAADVRVVNLSSELFKQAPKEGILLSRCKTPLEDVSSLARYGQSKLADYYHTHTLSQLYPSVKFVAIHPGVVNTGIFDDFKKKHPWLGGLVSAAGSVMMTDVQAGARAQLWASTANKESVKSGAFYNQKLKEFKEGVLYDKKAEKDLWDWTELEFQSQGN